MEQLLVRAVAEAQSVVSELQEALSTQGQEVAAFAQQHREVKTLSPLDLVQSLTFPPKYFHGLEFSKGSRVIKRLLQQESLLVDVTSWLEAPVK